MSGDTDLRPIVLVVDDRPNMIGLIRKVLAEDVRVLGATSGREAIRFLETEPVAVAVVDLRMPDLDGLAVLAECRRLRPSTKFVLMTAYASLDTAVEALRLGAHDYLIKPVDPEVVRSVVLRAVSALAQSTEGSSSDGPPAGNTSEDLAAMPWTRALESATTEVARKYLEEVLRRSRGRVAEAAARAGVERESFYRLMRRYGVRARPSRTNDEPDE